MNISVFLLISYSFLSTKIGKKKLLILSVLFVLFEVLLSFLSIDFVTNIYIIIISLVCLYTFYDASFKQKIGIFMLFIVCDIFGDLLARNIFNYIIGNNFDYISLLFFEVIKSTISLIIGYSCLSIYSLKKRKYHSIFFVFLFCFQFLIIIIGLDLNYYYQVIDIDNYFLVLLLSLFVSNLIIFYLYYQYSNKIIQENNLKNEYQKNLIKSKNMKKILQNQNIYLHEIRKNSLDMIDYLENKEYDELKKYITQKYENCLKLYNMTNTNSELLDILLLDRIYLFQSNNIQINTEIESDFFDFCEIYEAEKVLSDMIDFALLNCISSCLKKSSLIIRSIKIEKKNIFVLMYSSKLSNKEEIVNKFNECLSDFISKYKIEVYMEYKEKENINSITFIYFS